ncbi:MAG: dTDP-4-dehydrorhamnose reductase [Chitinophagales bacterium]|jgi:dTDP-4-dehydrorhamnose reductase|nr:dTDP-4-dehydrorhamnose reductase [Chitinophagales bacterium]
MTSPKPYRVLVTGAAGQVGSELVHSASNYRTTFDLHAASRADLDIATADSNTLAQYIQRHDITAVINAAAYTKVDAAEADPEMAYRVNAQAVRNLSQACAATGCALLHYSTDFVFDGQKNTPYTETDPTNPIGVYGKSKYDGEIAALAANPRCVVVRTSWVYSSKGNNFVKTMLRLSAERTHINVVYDQVGSPTYAADLAQASWQILQALLADAQHPAWGKIFHYANQGVSSWFDLAYQVVQRSGNACTVTPIETKDYPTPARRPAYSVLATNALRQTFGIDIPYWRDSLMQCLLLLDQK